MRVGPSGWGQCCYRRDLTELPRPSHRVRTEQEGSGYTPGRGSSAECDHAAALILDFLDCENQVSVVYKTPKIWCFVTTAPTDEDKDQI